MNQRRPKQALVTARLPRQQKLDFTRSRHWPQLPRAAQQACRQSLARLLCEVILQTDQEDNDEREDSIATP